MALYKKKLGFSGEDLACKFLREEKRYKILERNYRTKLGEIDIIAIDKDTLVFVEVKTRKGTKFGLPQQAVNQKKLEHIKKAGYMFIKHNRNLPQKYRIDVISILLDNDEVRSINLIKVY